MQLNGYMDLSMKAPLGVQRPRLEGSAGTIFLLSIVIGTAISGCLGNITIGGRQLCGIMWVSQLALAISVILASNRRYIPFPYAYWLPWMIWCSVRCDFQDPAAVQRTVMFVACPIVAMAAARVVRTTRRLEWFLRLFGWAVLVIGLVVLLGLSRICGSVPGIAATMCVGASYFSSRTYREPNKGILKWAYCVACCAIVGSRMATLVTLAVLPASPLPYRWRLRAVFTGGSLLLCIGALLLPAIRAKTFSDDVSPQDMWGERANIRTSGRLTVWPIYLEEALRTPWFGAGATADLQVVENLRSSVHWEHPHNEYLRVFLNYGIVGLVLLGMALTLTAISLHSLLRTTYDSTLQTAAGTGLSGLIAMALLALSGNVLIYIAFFGFILFALIGATYGAYSARGPVIRPGRCNVGRTSRCRF